MKVRFHENASYHYGQDHGLYCGPLPSDREFEVEVLTPDKLKLTARGYGVIGHYGAGSIYMTNSNFIAAISAEMIGDRQTPTPFGENDWIDDWM